MSDPETIYLGELKASRAKIGRPNDSRNRKGTRWSTR
jgi:hypothetical protein